jgi:hypothetical protein
MERLSDTYRLRSRYRRSARIDKDLDGPDALGSYTLNDSAWEVLSQVFEHLNDSPQRAFTWTGPFGAGKSSLALLLASFLGTDNQQRQEARRIIGPARQKKLFKGLIKPNNGWLIIPVVGARRPPEDLIEEALLAAVKRRWPTRKPQKIKDALGALKPGTLVQSLMIIGEAVSESGDGLLLLFDELGKTLEGLSEQGGDLQLFQELAENFGRTDANCVLVGILHQSFQEYAARAGRSAQNEWAKVQGRFVDIPFSVSIEEVVALIGDAIEGPEPPAVATKLCHRIVCDFHHPRLSGIKGFDGQLASCWPLHPVTALLLGPLSRARFGQNERSTFGFLASNEPLNFRSFLSQETNNSAACYGVDLLWDYLQINFESAVLASGDGHRWSEAAEAVERSKRLDNPVALSLAKTIGLIDLFGRNYGIIASEEILTHCCIGQTKKTVKNALKQLENSSIAIHRRHLSGWALFAGSDIDLDAVIDQADAQIGSEFSDLRPYLPQLPPAVAKRHYHQTGSLRWFKLCSMTRTEIESDWKTLLGDMGQSGCFILVMPDSTNGLIEDDLDQVCRHLSGRARQEEIPLAFGAAGSIDSLINLARETAAIEKARATTPELEGDAVARREVTARLNYARSQLADVVEHSFNSATWFLPGIEGGRAAGNMSRLASALADYTFSRAPIIHNELVNREKLSSSAAAARRTLLYRMVDGGNLKDLGIEGYPAELGIYKGLLESTGLHAPVTGGAKQWKFSVPHSERADSSYQILLEDFSAFLAASELERRSFKDLYDHWREPPFGMRSGVMPIFALAFILARQDDIALYDKDAFIPSIDDFFVDRLLQAPSEIALQHFKVAGVRQDILKKIAEVVTENDTAAENISKPLEVAKPLAKFAFRLMPWVKRTRHLSPETLAIRDALTEAQDPNVLLFIDLPRACGLKEDLGEKASDTSVADVVRRLRQAIVELGVAYEKMLRELGETICAAFGYHAFSASVIVELGNRGSKIAGVTGDLRLDGFARRLSGDEQLTGWVEGIGGLAANKPPRDWTDFDLERAKIEIVSLARQFQRVERVLTTRDDEGTSLRLNGAVSYGAVAREIDVAVALAGETGDRVTDISEKLYELLKKNGADERTQLAVIARMLFDLTDVSDPSGGSTETQTADAPSKEAEI